MFHYFAIAIIAITAALIAALAGLGYYSIVFPRQPYRNILDFLLRVLAAMPRLVSGR